MDRACGRKTTILARLERAETVLRRRVLRRTLLHGQAMSVHDGRRSNATVGKASAADGLVQLAHQLPLLSVLTVVPAGHWLPVEHSAIESCRGRHEAGSGELSRASAGTNGLPDERFRVDTPGFAAGDWLRRYGDG